MKRTPVSLGDAIRAMADLAPRDAETRAAIRDMLGFDDESVVPVQPGVGVWKPTAALTPEVQALSGGPGPLVPTAGSRASRSAMTAAAGGSRLQRITLPIDRPSLSRVRPAWVSEPGAPLGPAALESPAPAPPALFRAPRGRAILSAALATSVAEGEIDFNKLIETIAHVQPVTVMPRLLTPTLRRGVQVLIDRGAGMDPFRADQDGLITSLDDILSDDRLEVLYFAGCPSRGAGSGPRSAWRAWQPPPPGTPVLTVTDLGLGGPMLDADRSTPTEWLNFAHRVRDDGYELFALVPYDARRWPARLVRAMTIMHWSERTTVGEVRRAVRRAYERAK